MGTFKNLVEKADRLFKSAATSVREFGHFCQCYWWLFAGAITITSMGYLAWLFYSASATERPGYAVAVITLLLLAATAMVAWTAFQALLTNQQQLRDNHEMTRRLNRPFIDLDVAFTGAKSGC